MAYSGHTYQIWRFCVKPFMRYSQKNKPETVIRNIFTAHAQKQAQVYIRAQIWQHHSTQQPRKPNSHEIIALRQRMWTKIAYFHCACAETGIILHPIKIWTAPFDSATPKTCPVVMFSLYDEGCGRKSHIFTAHAQKLAQVYIRQQIWQHRSTQRPRKPNSHQIIALRQRIRWGACSQHYMRREHCVQWLVYFYVTLYNRFGTSLRYGNIILFIYFLDRIIRLFFVQKSSGCCLIPMQIKESGKNGPKVSIIVFKFPSKSAKIRILCSCLARPSYTSDASVDKTRSTANLSAVRSRYLTNRIKTLHVVGLLMYRSHCDTIIAISRPTQTSAQWVM